jgi:uncharacterized protein with HEPN domain
MDDQSLKLIEQIQESTEFILGFTSVDGWSFAAADRMTQLAVERSFELIGVVLARLQRHSPTLISSISGYSNMLAFGNRITHGYDDDLDPDDFDERIGARLPILRRELTGLTTSFS